MVEAEDVADLVGHCGLEAVAFPAGLEDLIEEYGREDDAEDRDEEWEGRCHADVLHHSRAAPV